MRRLIIGRCRSGKSECITDRITAGLNSGHNAIYFCREMDADTVIAKAKGVPLVTEDSGVFRCHLSTLGNKFPQARLTILTMTNEEFMSSHFPHEVTIPTVENTDYYIDDARFWGSRLNTSSSNNLTVCHQSYFELQCQLGKSEARAYVETFDEVEIFSIADHHGVDLAIELSKQTLNDADILALEQGEFFRFSTTGTSRHSQKPPRNRSFVARILRQMN